MDRETKKTLQQIGCERLEWAAIGLAMVAIIAIDMAIVVIISMCIAASR